MIVIFTKTNDYDFTDCFICIEDILDINYNLEKQNIHMTPRNDTDRRYISNITISYNDFLYIIDKLKIDCCLDFVNDRTTPNIKFHVE